MGAEKMKAYRFEPANRRASFRTEGGRDVRAGEVVEVGEERAAAVLEGTPGRVIDGKRQPSLMPADGEPAADMADAEAQVVAGLASRAGFARVKTADGLIEAFGRALERAAEEAATQRGQEPQLNLGAVHHARLKKWAEALGAETGEGWDKEDSLRHLDNQPLGSVRAQVEGG